MTRTLEKNSTPPRREKKYMRGVCFDSRSRKFVASITINGRRIYLGSFEEEDDAAAAHALARHDNPIKRGARGSGAGQAFVDAYDDFLAAYADDYGLKKGELQEGAVFDAPSGQRYVLASVDVVRKPNSKAAWYYNRWHSNCSECGADFITSTMAGTKKVSGLTRTCPTHRKGGARGDEPSAHVVVLKAVRAAQAAANLEERKTAEVNALLAEQPPGATREENRALREAARAVVEARYASGAKDLT